MAAPTRRNRPMSKKTSKRRWREEDDFISHESWPFRKRLQLPRESPPILIQLCAPFNIYYAYTAVSELWTGEVSLARIRQAGLVTCHFPKRQVETVLIASQSGRMHNCQGWRIEVLTRLRQENLLPCGHDSRALRSTYFISSIKLASTTKAASLSACRLKSSLWRGLPDDASAGLPRGQELDSSLGCGCMHLVDCALNCHSTRGNS
jgi:hypothetical protein